MYYSLQYQYETFNVKIKKIYAHDLQHKNETQKWRIDANFILKFEWKNLIQKQLY